MCGHRGLEVESDLQTYEISLTTGFRSQFDKILGPLREERAGGGWAPTAAAATGGGGARASQQQQSGRFVCVRVWDGVRCAVQVVSQGSLRQC